VSIEKAEAQNNASSEIMADQGSGFPSQVSARQGGVLPESIAIKANQGESSLLKDEQTATELGGKEAKVCELFPRQAS